MKRRPPREGRVAAKLAAVAEEVARLEAAGAEVVTLHRRGLFGSKASTMPPGFRLTREAEIACPHRDVSCCPTCAAAHDQIVEVVGAHYWIDDLAERDATRQAVAAFKVRP